MRKLMAALAGLIVTVAVPAAPAFAWTGCFVGAHAGGLWGSESWVNQTAGGDFFGLSLGGHDLSGPIGGVQAGCDYLFAGGLLIGVQGDFGWTDAVGSHPSTRETGVTYHSSTSSLASLTGRIGYASGKVLGYVRGGAAWAEDEYWATTTILGTAYTSSDTRTAWTVGVGGEYAFSPRLSGFVEYNFYDFGKYLIAFTPQVDGLRPAFVDITTTRNVVRAGINLRFGG